jgi:hypothetical protein
MSQLLMAAIGAMILAALSGCAMQRDAGSVSAMVRTDDARPAAASRAVTVDLSEILRP